MPKYTVIRSQRVLIESSVEIEADDPVSASRLAMQEESKLSWDGWETFENGDTDFETCDPDDVKNSTLPLTFCSKHGQSIDQLQTAFAQFVEMNKAEFNPEAPTPDLH